MPDADPLKNPDNAKITINSQAPMNSFASLSNSDELSNMMERTKTERSLEEGGFDMSGVVDPVDERYRRRRVDAESSVAYGPRGNIKRGDTAYDKKHKCEVSIREVSDQRARCRMSDGKDKWVKLEYLVKL